MQQTVWNNNNKNYYRKGKSIWSRRKILYFFLSFQDVYESNYEVCLYGLHGLDINETNVMALLPKIKVSTACKRHLLVISCSSHIDFRDYERCQSLSSWIHMNNKQCRWCNKTRFCFNSLTIFVIPWIQFLFIKWKSVNVTTQALTWKQCAFSSSRMVRMQTHH